MAKVTITVTDTPDGGVFVEYDGVPCPVHERPIQTFTQAEMWGYELTRSLARLPGSRSTEHKCGGSH